jgi:hypothetical protein
MATLLSYYARMGPLPKIEVKRKQILLVAEERRKSLSLGKQDGA